MSIDKYILFPYYLVLRLRNRMYDKGSIKSRSYKVPVICVGNVTVGGTGKTPHTEMLISLLKDKYNVAVVSRGYGRKGKKFKEVQEDDNYENVGDEPLQIKRKFPDIKVLVDVNRVEAIDLFLQESGISNDLYTADSSKAAASSAAASTADSSKAAASSAAASIADSSKAAADAIVTDNSASAKKCPLIILDDGFQYRKITPSLSIMLVNYYKPIFSDSLLPIGTLRDLPDQIKRADMVIVTKCPEYLDPLEWEQWRRKLRLSNGQKLLFSKIKYLKPKPVFPEFGDSRYIYAKSAILFSGIATNRSLIEHLSSEYSIDAVLEFGDHHKFSASDIRKLRRKSERRSISVLMTTEKDAQRLRNSSFVPDSLKRKIFYLPIETQIIPHLYQDSRLIEEDFIAEGDKQIRETLFAELGRTRL